LVKNNNALNIASQMKAIINKLHHAQQHIIAAGPSYIRNKE